MDLSLHVNKTLVKHGDLGGPQTSVQDVWGLLRLVLGEGAGDCFSHMRAHRLQEWFLRAGLPGRG